eukprot:1131470-Pyramimonas_sp.AAC.1
MIHRTRLRSAAPCRFIAGVPGVLNYFGFGFDYFSKARKDCQGPQSGKHPPRWPKMAQDGLQDGLQDGHVGPRWLPR